MKTTERFDKAIERLYIAFNKGNLIAGECSKCAVGNMVGGFIWYNHMLNMKLHKSGTTLKESAIKFFNSLECKVGYSYEELREVESIFEKAMYHAPKYDVEAQFNALVKVIEYLCELEGIENVMEHTQLFERVLEKHLQI